MWEIMVRVRVDRNISMLDVYSKALRPALSIKKAAMATDTRRTTPTRAASYLQKKKKIKSRSSVLPRHLNTDNGDIVCVFILGWK